jgi:hypothetical protein
MLKRLSRLLAALLAAAWSLVPAAAATAPAPAARAASPETIVELRALLAAGQCPELLARIAALPKQPPSADLLVFEGNCRLREATHRARVFDASRYERARVGAGGQALDPAATAQFYRWDITWDDPARAQALALFEQALVLDPARQDLVVGAIAANLEGGRPGPAVALFEANAARLDEASRIDLYQVVQDRLALGRVEEASALASALAAASPASAAAQAAAGSAALARHDLAAAAAAFEKAAAGGPLTPEQARELALLAMLRRDWNAAVNALAPSASKSVELTTWFALARGRIEPRSATPIWQEIKRSLAKVEKPDPRATAVVDYFLGTSQASPPPAAAARVRAARRFLEGRIYVPALVEADRAVFEDPQSVAGYKTLADVYRALGYPELGLEPIEQAIATAAKDPKQSGYGAGELQRERAELLFAAGRDADAAAAFAEAARAGAPVPYAWGLAALAAGRRDEAVAQLQAAAASGGPDAAAARAKLEELGVGP